MRPVVPPKWNNTLDDLDIKLTAELPRVSVGTSALAALKPGDLIPLPAGVVNNVRLLFEGTPKFSGVLGNQSARWAVKISSVLKK